VETIKNILRLQLFKFIIAGLICAGIEFLLFSLMIVFIQLNYLLANLISIIIAISLNYIISRKYVFEKSRYAIREEFLSFVFFSALALILNQISVWAFTELLKLNVSVSKAVSIAIVAIFNYITKKHIVFKT